jgi:hypothetical protein
MLWQAKETRLGVSGLGSGSDSANFDEGESQPAKGVDGVSLFVEAGSEADRVLKRQSHAFDRLGWRHLGSKGSQYFTLLG